MSLTAEVRRRFVTKRNAGAAAVPPDVIAPLPVTITVLADGETLELVCDSVVEIGSGGSDGLLLSASGGAATVTYTSGSGTNTLLYDISRPITEVETLTADYTQPGDGIEDEAGNDLASFSGETVVNDSAVPQPAPTATWAVSSDGRSIVGTFSRAVSVGSDGPTAGLVVVPAVNPGAGSGVDGSEGTLTGIATPTFASLTSGDGTTVLTWLLGTRIINKKLVETIGITFTAGANRITADDDGQQLASFTNTAATNNSTVQNYFERQSTAGNVNTSLWGVGYNGTANGLTNNHSRVGPISWDATYVPTRIAYYVDKAGPGSGTPTGSIWSVIADGTSLSSRTAPDVIVLSTAKDCATDVPTEGSPAFIDFDHVEAGVKTSGNRGWIGMARTPEGDGDYVNWRHQSSGGTLGGWYGREGSLPPVGSGDAANWVDLDATDNNNIPSYITYSSPGVVVP